MLRAPRVPVSTSAGSLDVLVRDCWLARIISVNRDARPVRRVPCAGACGSFFAFRAASGSIRGYCLQRFLMAAGPTPPPHSDHIHICLTEAPARRGARAGGAASADLARSEALHIAFRRRAARRRGVNVSDPPADVPDLSAMDLGFDSEESGCRRACMHNATPSWLTTSSATDGCTLTIRSSSSANVTNKWILP